jgi:hypothetical protein
MAVADVYGTDLNGTVIVTTDGVTYQVTSQKQASPRAPPTAVPTAAQAIVAPAQLSLEVLSLTSPVSAGSNASIRVKTLPGANCTITVHYKSGPSSAAGLEPKAADANGEVSWRWKVGSRTSPGNWRIVVTASHDGKTVAQDTTFTVE